MNRFEAILKTGIVFVFFIFFIFSNSHAQPRDKQWVYQMGHTAYQNKVKKDIQAIIQSGQLPENASPAVPNATSSIFTSRSQDNAISESQETESEIHAAVNPNDTANIIVGAMKFSTGGLLGAELSFPIYYTKDFGATWQLSQFNGVNDLPPFSLVVGGGDPIIVFDHRGVAYFSWLTLTLDLSFTIKMALHWATSEDGGASWKRQTTFIDGGELSGDAEAPTGRLVDKQWMAADVQSSRKGNVYVAYTEINLSDTTYNILVKTKPTTSDTFFSAVDVTPEEIVFAQFSSIDVDAFGNVHLIFAGATNDEAAFGLYHCKSTDGGASFSVPVRISDFNLPCFPPGVDSTCAVVGIDARRMYPCPHLRVDKSGDTYDGTLYVVWTADGTTAKASEGLDIYFSKSADNGKTWSVPRILNTDTNKNLHQFFPSIAVNETGKVVITWYDRREDPNNLLTRYYMTVSRDGGDTFEPDFAVAAAASDFSVIGQSNADFGVGEYTQVVTTPNYAIPFWADGRSNDGNIEVFTSLIPIAEDQTTSLEEIGTIATPMNIRGIYPNPVQEGEATIELELKEETFVTIRLFDSKGALLQTLINRRVNTGLQRFSLNLKDIPSGQYFCVVNSDKGFKAKSLIVKN